jgi:hypothetical protein
MATTKGVFREPLAIPVVQSYGPTPNLKLYDNHINTLNKGLLSVAQTISTMHTKVTELEKTAVANENLKLRVDALEKTLNAQAKILSDIHGLLNKSGKLPTSAVQVPQKKALPTQLRNKPLLHIPVAVKEELEEVMSKPTTEEVIVHPKKVIEVKAEELTVDHTVEVKAEEPVSNVSEPAVEVKAEEPVSNVSELTVEPIVEVKVESAPTVDHTVEVKAEELDSNVSLDIKNLEVQPIKPVTEEVKVVLEPTTQQINESDSDDPTMDAMLSALGVDPKKATSVVIEDEEIEISESESASTEESESASEEEEEIKVSKLIVKPITKQVSKPVPKQVAKPVVRQNTKPIIKQNPITKKK